MPWIDSVFSAFRPDELLTITGGTNGGVPGMVAAYIAGRSFPLVGIMPARAWKYVAPAFTKGTGNTSLIKVPPLVEPDGTWGDATSVLVSCAEVIVVHGGEWGTLIEVAQALKMNAGRVRLGAPSLPRPVVIIPIGKFSGPAHLCKGAIWMDPALRRRSYPSRTIRTPQQLIIKLRSILDMKRSP